jgi:Cu2+-containing amine oxidase
MMPTYVIDSHIAAGDKEFIADERVRAALTARGVTDLSTVIFSVYCAGYMSEKENAAHGLRIVRTLVLVCPHTTSKNFYAHPIENLVITSDLDGPRIIEVEDYGAQVPIPKWTANYDSEGIRLKTNVPCFPNGPRQDLKTLCIEQNLGPRYFFTLITPMYYFQLIVAFAL